MTFSAICDSIHEFNAPVFGDFAAADAEERPAKWSFSSLLFVTMSTFAAMGSAQAATGAHVSVEFTKAKPALLAGPSCVDVKVVASNANDLPTLKEQISFLRGCMGVNVSELSELMGVSRQTFYGWIKGAVPQGENLVRLEELFGVAKRFAALELERPDTVIHRPVFDGESLYTLMLKRQIPSQQQLDQLGHLGKREAQQRTASAQGQPIQSFDDALSAAVPIAFS